MAGLCTVDILIAFFFFHFHHNSAVWVLNLLLVDSRKVVPVKLAKVHEKKTWFLLWLDSYFSFIADN